VANLAERTDPSATMTDAAEARLDRMLEAATAAGLEAALITSDESIALQASIKPRTEATDLANIAASASSSSISTIRSTPFAPITTGTPM